MKNIISDSLWNEIKNVIPKKNSNVGRPEMAPRKAFEGIAFVLKTGIQWKYLPEKYGATSTIHGKFMLWVRSGVFEKIMSSARDFYQTKNNNLPNWLATDTSSAKAPFANWAGKNPTDRGKMGIKKSILVDFAGAPIALSVGPANRHDSKFLDSTVKDAKIKIDCPTIIAADSAYDAKKLRRKCAKENLVLLASTNQRRDENKEKYNPQFRWIVERTFGWFSWNRSLKICWCKTIESFTALFRLASSIQLFKMSGVK